MRVRRLPFPVLSRFRYSNTLAGAGAACLAFLSAGCVPREEGVVRLRVSFWSPPGLEERVAREFEASHPGVKIDLLITGGRYAEKIQSMIVASNEPDVMMVHDTFYHDWAARNVFGDVTPLVHELDTEDPFMPMPLMTLRSDGGFDAVPFSTTAMATFGNLELLAAAGVAFPWTSMTWEEIEALAPQFSRYGGNPDSPTSYLCALPQEPYFLVAFGARAFDDLHHPTRVVVDSPQTLEAIKYWRRMHQRGWAVPRSTVLDRGESELFRDGHVALLFEARASVRILMGNPDLKWDVAPVPAPATGDGKVPSITVGLAISRRTKHADLAREYIRFYLSDEAMAIPLAAGHVVPTRRGQVARWLQQPMAESAETFVRPLESGISAVAYSPGRLEVETLIRRRFEQSLAEPDLPAEHIVAGLAADLQAWLERMQEKGLL